jgi:hypothetical protein
MIIIKNKKAQAGAFLQIFSFVFFLAIFLVPIVLALNLHFSSDYDFRAIDSEILALRLKSCFSKNQFEFNSLDSFENELFTVCRLNPKVIKEHYLISISINDQEKYSWRADESQCLIGKSNKNYPQCITSSFKLDSNTYQLLIGTEQKSVETIS